MRNQETGELQDSVTFGDMTNTKNKNSVIKSVSCPTATQDGKEVPSLLSNVGSTYGLGILI